MENTRQLQWDLVSLGYGNIMGNIDGIKGAKTIKAVRKLQEIRKLKVDGIPGVQTQKEIKALKKQAGFIGTRNFDIDEFRSPDTGTLPKNGMDAQLILKLEWLRWRCGNRPVTITSGYRTDPFNKQIGGYKWSNHVKGEAADIKISGVSPKKVQEEADRLFDGVGRYTTFTHVDVTKPGVRFTGKY